MYCMKLLETKGVQRKENCTLSLLLAKYSVGFSDLESAGCISEVLAFSCTNEVIG